MDRKKSAVKVLRISRGWDQSELAKKSGLHQSRISMIENGLEPNEKDLNALKRAFGIDD